MADENVARDVEPVMHYYAKTKKKKAVKKKVPRLFQPQWAELPDLVLDNIFSRLSIQERYYASLACWSWHRGFYSSQVWSTFQLHDTTLTRRRYNYYMGYQRTIDHIRAQICLRKMGKHFRKIIIHPIANFFNLYEFLTMVSSYAEVFEGNPLRYVHTLEFSFACHLIERGNLETKEDIFGTGGRLLLSLKRFMDDLPGLKHLVLNDLLLERYEAISLLDDVVENCGQSLQTLRLVNCSRGWCPVLHVGVLFGLRELFISPQQLSDDVVFLLAYTNLRSLHIVQTIYTEQTLAVSAAAWNECKKSAPFLKVHLRVEGNVQQTILWQEKAPVASITYDSAHIRVGLHLYDCVVSTAAAAACA